MNAKTKIEDFPRFDAAEHLKDEGDIAAYLTVVQERRTRATAMAAHAA